MLRFKRITAIILLLIAASIVVSNNVLGNPGMLKPVVSLTGKVLEKSENKPLVAKIFIYNIENEKIGVCKSDVAEGTYFLTGLKPNSVYYLSIETSDKKYDKIKITTPKVYEYTEIIRDLIVDNNEELVEVLTKK
jgi:hypothetical protein